MTAPQSAPSVGSSTTATHAEAEHTWYRATVLSIVAGYADTLGYLNFNAFTGLMTGNTVLLGVALEAGTKLAVDSST